LTYDQACISIEKKRLVNVAEIIAQEHFQINIPQNLKDISPNQKYDDFQATIRKFILDEVVEVGPYWLLKTTYFIKLVRQTKATN